MIGISSVFGTIENVSKIFFGLSLYSVGNYTQFNICICLFILVISQSFVFLNSNFRFLSLNNKKYKKLISENKLIS